MYEVVRSATPGGSLEVRVLRVQGTSIVTDVEIHILTADVMTLDVASFDGFHTMITDPPYSDHVHENMASHGTHGRGSRPRDPGFDSCSTPLRLRISEIAARMSRWSLVFTDMQSAHYWDISAGRDVDCVRWVPWIRWSQPQLSGDRPPSGAEMVCHYHRAGAKHWSGPGNLTHYSRRCLRGADKHPTEKPLDLLLDMVSWFSDPGENVLDVCAGAGTTALAAKLLGRSCLAIEIDPRWHEVATARRAALTDRDRTRALEWCETTIAEATECLKAPATDENANTLRRAAARLEDANRVRAWL